MSANVDDNEIPGVHRATDACYTGRRMSTRDSCLAVATVGLLLSTSWLSSSCHSYRTNSSSANDDAASGAAGAPTAGPSAGVDAGGAGGDAESQAGSPSNGGVGGDDDPGSGGLGPGGGGAAPDNLDPSSFRGLALWLDVADERCSVDGDGRIMRCADGSEHQNHADQALPKLRPHLVKTAVSGHATMHFEAPDSQARTLVVTDAPSLRLGKQDFVVALVAAWTNSTDVVEGGYGGYGIMLTKQTMFDPYVGLALLANYPGLASNHPTAPRFGLQLDLDGSYALSSSTKLNDGAFRLLVARRTGLELEVRVNGVSETRMQTVSVLDISNEGSPLVLGGVNGSPLLGDIAEVALVGGPVAEPQLEQLEAYFLEKYRL
jgi:hypothetical protein